MVKNKEFVKTNLLYILFVIEDPLFLFKNQELNYQLKLNNENRTSLIKNFSKVSEGLVPEYLAVILLNSADINGDNELRLELSY